VRAVAAKNLVAVVADLLRQRELLKRSPLQESSSTIL